MPGKWIGYFLGGLAVLSAPATWADEDLGGSLYATYCAACHGEDGKGDDATARILAVNVGDLTALAAANGGEFPTDYVRRIVDGRGGPGPHVVKGKAMPAWGRLLQEGDTTESRDAVAARRIDALVGYVRRMQDPSGQ